MGEVEENCYRHAGEFEEHEIKGMRKMFTTNLQETLFDKAWIDLDLLELDHFDFNNYDNRFELLEKWFFKKEREIQTRLYLPQEELKSNNFYASKIKEKTRELMSKVFGKDYNEINERDLNEFVNGLCSRMLLFGREFPSFLPYLVSEVVNHPSINPIDKDQLESY